MQFCVLKKSVLKSRFARQFESLHGYQWDPPDLQKSLVLVGLIPLSFFRSCKGKKVFRDTQEKQSRESENEEKRLRKKIFPYDTTSATRKRTRKVQVLIKWEKCRNVLIEQQIMMLIAN